ncbi:MAG: hypothetical protein LBJ46_00550 [Planctomycetota bacterium]|jgi:hypothetical protein|nr:hypothetical protein [Planctomycetota bacterium]
MENDEPARRIAIGAEWGRHDCAASMSVPNLRLESVQPKVSIGRGIFTLFLAKIRRERNATKDRRFPNVKFSPAAARNCEN